MIVILGTPGSGKTTQTLKLAKHLNCPWFSMGELIRQHTTGRDRQEMLSGKIIEDEITLQILSDALSAVDTARDEVIVEGNPRTIPQADWWLDKIRSGEFKITGIIHLVIEPSVAKDRLAKRGRIDDHSHEVIDKRFAEYKRLVEPTLEYLKKNGMPVYVVDASAGPDEVFSKVCEVLALRK